MSNICDFCKKSFKTQITLKKHIKSAKYCLSLQKQEDDEDEDDNDDIKEYTCEGCSKIFTNKRNTILHTENCMELKIKNIRDKYENEIKSIRKEYDNKISILEEKLEIYKSDHECVQEIAKQPKINNTINNKYLHITPFILKEGEIARKVKYNFTEEMFLDGQQGVADFTYNNILKDDNGESKYICNDMNRGNFIYKDDKGEMKTDYKADKLINMIYKPVVEKSEILKNSIIAKNDNIETKTKCLDKIVEIKHINNVSSNNKFRNRIGILQKRNDNLPLIEDTSIKDLIPIDNEYLISQSKYLTEEYVQKGIDGYIDFALNYSFKNRVCCQDNILIYKRNIKDEIKIEDNWEEICIDFFNSINKDNQKVCRLLCKKIDDEILLLEDEEIVDEEKHNELEELLDNLCNNITSISNIKLDTERKFLEDFMIGICDRLKK